MNKKINISPTKKSLIRQLTLRAILEYTFSLFLFFIAVIAFLLLAWDLSHRITWYANDPLYQFLSLLKEYILLPLGIILSGGWIFLTWYFLSRPLRYLHEILQVCGQLAQPSAEPILLPKPLISVQDELNLVREQALRNALLAREAEQRKNDMIVYLAHDLKTPLTSVIGYLTLLTDEPQISDDLRTKYIGIAHKKAQRLEELINEFFDITRFSLMTLTLEPQHINFSRMLEQIISEFSPILEEKELSWETDIEPDVEILCDPDKLERVIDNLIRNALGYSYPHTAVHESLCRTSPEDPLPIDNAGASVRAASVADSVCLRVQNHGQTIAPEKLERIFDQFFRLDSARSSSTGGAGLGLAIAREIVTLHGGSIRAESASESILFTVILPTNCRKDP